MSDISKKFYGAFTKWIDVVLCHSWGQRNLTEPESVIYQMAPVKLLIANGIWYHSASCFYLHEWASFLSNHLEDTLRWDFSGLDINDFSRGLLFSVKNTANTGIAVCKVEQSVKTSRGLLVHFWKPITKYSTKNSWL
jgi:hypothetical protein